MILNFVRVTPFRFPTKPVFVMIALVAALLLATGLSALPSSGHNTEIVDHPSRSPIPPAQDSKTPPLHKAGGSAQRNIQAQLRKRGKQVPRRVPLRRHPPLGCEQFSWPEGIKNLAIVGNGPLSIEDRKGIQGCDSVMRFNKMENFECDDPVTVWMLRYSYEAPDKYHGLNSPGKGCNSADVLKKANQVWLMDGEEWWLKEALKKHPDLKSSGKSVWADGRQWERKYSKMAEVGVRGRRRRRKWMVKGVSPSSGWLGISIALDCKPPGVEVHLYAMNWHNQLWETHLVDREENFWRAMARQNQLTIHETECKGLRGCEDAAKVDMLQMSSRVAL